LLQNNVLHFVYANRHKSRWKNEKTKTLSERDFALEGLRIPQTS